MVSDFYLSNATFTPASAVYLKVAGKALSHRDCPDLDFTNSDYLEFNALALNSDSILSNSRFFTLMHPFK
jgi:hypothetical protein